MWTLTLPASGVWPLDGEYTPPLYQSVLEIEIFGAF